MEKALKVFFVLLLLCTGTYNLAYAEGEVPITLKIYAGDEVLFDDSLSVTPCPESPEVDAPVSANGKCAIEQSGLSNTFTWSDFDGDGKLTDGFLDELGGNSSDFGNNFFWNWFSDLEYGMTSLNSHQLESGEGLLLTYNSYPLRVSASGTSGVIGDTLTFTVEEMGFDSNFNAVWMPSSDAIVTLGGQSCTTIADGTCAIILDASGLWNAIGSKTLHVPSSTLNIEVLPPPPSSSSGGGSSGGSSSRRKKAEAKVLGAETKASFDLKKAYEFLLGEQKENGSWGSDLYTDWAALALATGNYQEQAIKLIKYFGESRMENPRLTDYERRAMALMALGLSPYGTGGVNYIEKISGSFDGAQFGNVLEDNDDIFALIVLGNAGYTPEEEMIKKGAAFVLGRQRANGSWDESVDMTGAALAALSRMEESEPVENARDKAKNFLKETQNEKTGGWGGNASATAWVLQGILALNEKPEDWAKNGSTPRDFLTTLQDTDGGIKNDNLNNKIWETAYVLSALSGKTWSDTMQKFEKIETSLAVPKPKSPTPKPKISAPKIEIAPNEDIVPELNLETKTAKPNKGWLRKLLGSIFRF